MWILSICMAVFMGACSTVNKYEYTTKAECEEALEDVYRGAHKPAYAICTPERK